MADCLVAHCLVSDCLVTNCLVIAGWVSDCRVIYSRWAIVGERLSGERLSTLGWPIVWWAIVMVGYCLVSNWPCDRLTCLLLWVNVAVSNWLVSDCHGGLLSVGDRLVSNCPVSDCRVSDCHRSLMAILKCKGSKHCWKMFFVLSNPNLPLKMVILKMIKPQRRSIFIINDPSVWM